MSKSSRSAKQRSSSKVSRQSVTTYKTSSNTIWLVVALIIFAFAIAAFILLQNQSSSASSLPAEIDTAQAYDLYQSGAYFLDVRTPEEWQDFHIPNTTLIPLDELPKRISEVPQGQRIVVVCRSGNRSQEGRDILRRAGFEQVSSMAGGLLDWRAAGYPVVNGP
jgi:rhodanese-related sulfurtransferase